MTPDQMFMHTPWFYYELTFCNLRKDYNTPTELEQKFNETLEKEQNCYAVKTNMRNNVRLTYQEAFGETNSPVAHETYTSYSNDNAIPCKALPGLYNRDIAHAIDIPVTSLYSDKELYFLIYISSDELKSQPFHDSLVTFSHSLSISINFFLCSYGL